MTAKELMYLDDALSHTHALVTHCQALASQLSDPALRTLANDLIHKNNELFASFYSVV